MTAAIMKATRRTLVILAIAGVAACVMRPAPASSEGDFALNYPHLAMAREAAVPAQVARTVRLSPARVDVMAAVDRHSSKHAIPPEFFHRLVKRESGYRLDAVGPATRYGRAYGPTQILCSTARGLGEHDCARLTRDPDRAVELGALYLKQGYAATGSWAGATAYYHGGPNKALHGRKTAAYTAAVAGAYSGQRIAWNVAPMTAQINPFLEVRG